MFLRPNVEKLRAKGDAPGLWEALSWAQASGRAKLGQAATDALISLIPELKMRGDVATLGPLMGVPKTEVQRLVAKALASIRTPEALDALVGRISYFPVVETALVEDALNDVLTDASAVSHLRRESSAKRPSHLPSPEGIATIVPRSSLGSSSVRAGVSILSSFEP